MMKKVLLTGASGTIGFEVLKQLCKKVDQYDITVFDLKTNKSRRKFAPYRELVNIVFGSVFNVHDLRKVCADQDVVIHLAAIIPPLADQKPDLAFQVNTEGTQKLIQLLEKSSPTAFFIYSSSISVYGDRLQTPMINIGDEVKASEGDEYAVTKIKAESIIQGCQLDWSIFRLAAIMGGHKMSKLMFHQPLKTSMEIATAEDTARAFVNAIEKRDQLSKKTFNLGGGASCRILYDAFLERSFEISGLGKPDFPPKTFAEKNFHCGFYEDGDLLNDILHFRKDSLESYFEKEKQKVSPFRRSLISIFKKPIKSYLQKQSEPLQAHESGDKEMIQHYFNESK